MAGGDEMTDRLEGEVQAAADDAELEREDIYIVVPSIPPAPDAPAAVWWEPGETLIPHSFLQDDEDVDRANEEAHKNKHRIGVRGDLIESDFGRAHVAAQLRHEMEHARQYNYWGGMIFDLDATIDEVLAAKIEDGKGASLYYNVKPVELDANAAASIYVRTRYPEQLQALLDDGDSAALVRSKTPPEGIETLYSRSIAFLYLFERAFASVASPSAPADWLDTYAFQTGRVWRSLAGADPEPPQGLPEIS